MTTTAHFEPLAANDAEPSPSRAQPLALGELAGPSDSAGPPLLPADAHPLHHVKARLQVSVGEATVTIGELLSARLHQVFVLDRRVEQAVDVLVEGRVVARGELIAVDDRFAVRISELPVPLKT